MTVETFGLLLLIGCVLALAVALHFMADAHPTGCDCRHCSAKDSR